MEKRENSGGKRSRMFNGSNLFGTHHWLIKMHLEITGNNKK